MHSSSCLQQHYVMTFIYGLAWLQDVFGGNFDATPLPTHKDGIDEALLIPDIAETYFMIHLHLLLKG